MKKIILILMCCAVNAWANSETLIKFQDTKTGKIGVKTQTGKIIIPAKYKASFNHQGDVIHEPFIELLMSERHKCDEKNSPVFAGGDVCDRKGNYLNSPLFFDMGMDDWQEGKRRVVENCQVGFVNEQNQKIIPARYGFALPFFYGYSQVIDGQAKKVYFKDSQEHWSVDLANDKAKWLIINEKGETVSGHLKPQAQTDIHINGKYYPTPYYFANELERNLVNQLNQLAVLSDMVLANHDPIQRKDNSLNFQITQRPRADFPYYTLTGFTHSRYEPNKKITIYADKQGRFFVDEYQMDTDKVKLKPLKNWLLKMAL